MKDNPLSLTSLVREFSLIGFDARALSSQQLSHFRERAEAAQIGKSEKRQDE